MPQFNGKQEGAADISRAPSLRCPRNGQTDGFVFYNANSGSINQPLGVLNTRLGRRWNLLRQPGYRPTRWMRAPGFFAGAGNLFRPSTVGDDGEGFC